MIRILYTVNGLRVNGMSAVIMHYITGLNVEDYTFTILTDEIAEQYIPILKDNNVRVIQSRNRRKNQVAYFNELCSVLKSGKFDVVHAHGNSATIAVEMLAAKIFGVPVRVVHSHNTTCKHPYLDMLLRPLFYWSYTHGIACGVEAGKWLFNNRKYIVVSNGIDLQKFAFDMTARQETRKKLGVTEKFVVGHIGRFTKQKNHEAILRIFKKITDSRDAILLLVGDGPRKEEMQQMASKLKIKDKVIFYGTTDNVAPLYSSMDVFLFPSKFEGVPLTLIEAQASGLPCLISNTISKEVEVSNNVKVFSLSDEDKWTDEIESTIDREKRSQKAVVKLRETGFDLETVISKLDKIYKSALGQENISVIKDTEFSKCRYNSRGGGE